MFPVSFPGVKTSRDDFLVHTNRGELVARISRYFDKTVSDDELRRSNPGVMAKTARFDATKVREQLLARGFREDGIVPYYYRPFDIRWVYWEPETKLLDEKRAEYFPHVFKGNLFLS